MLLSETAVLTDGLQGRTMLLLLLLLLLLPTRSEWVHLLLLRSC
jgi:hypothetical protein